MEEKNAIIESVSINTGDRGLLTAYLQLYYGDCGQGFGGYTLYLPKSYRHHADSLQFNFAGHFIFRCMEIGGAETWEGLTGKTIRVRANYSKIEAIGHIVKDDWFNPSQDFESLKKKEA